MNYLEAILLAFAISNIILITVGIIKITILEVRIDSLEWDRDNNTRK